MGKYKKLLNRVEKIEKHISENTEVVVELTELPEKWSIAVTEENKEYLKKYLHNDECIFYNMFYKVTIGSYFGFMSGNNCGHSQKYNTEEYTEITFDQFKKWVLKEDAPIQGNPEEVGKSAKIEYRPSGTFESIEDFCLDQLKDKYSITLKKPDIGNTDNSSSIRNIQVKVTSQEKANECIFIAKSYGEEISDIGTYAYGLYFGHNGSRHDGKFGFYYYDKNQEEISMDEFRHRFANKKIKPVEFDTFQKPALSTTEDSQSESKAVESDHLKEIDWSKQGQLVETSAGTIYRTNGNHKDDKFSAVFIQSKIDTGFSFGERRDNLSKICFKLCTEPITLKNE